MARLGRERNMWVDRWRRQRATLTRRAFPPGWKGEGKGRTWSRRQQRGRGPLGTIGSPVNQGINMLDTSPPRGNAFVTPGNIFLPLSLLFSLSLSCSFIPPRPCATLYTKVQPSFRSSPSLSSGLVLPHGRRAIEIRWRI